MTCCGGKRAALRANAPRVHAQMNPAQSAGTMQRDQKAGALVKYLGRGSFSLRGPVSGQVYVFRHPDLPVMVNENDVPLMIKSGLFVSA